MQQLKNLQTFNMLQNRLQYFQEQDNSLFGYLQAMRDTSPAVQQLKSGISEESDLHLHCEDTSLTMLHQFPAVKKAFLFHNYFLPSSAAIQRLFAATGQILVPRRSRLVDKKFEILLFLKNIN